MKTSSTTIPVQPRDAAARLTTDEGAEMGAAGLEPLSKQLLGALFEQSFPETGLRGLAYAEERKDIAKWLLGCATAHDEDSDYRLLATAGAWVASERADNDERFASLALVRSIAAYFVRMHATTLADVLTDDAIHPAKDGAL